MSKYNRPSMRSFFDNAYRWSVQTFGEKKPSGAVGSLQHLKREVDEAIKKPKDLMEYADLMHLVFDATWRAGYSYDDLLNACYAKLAINRNRTWKKPDADGVCEHEETPEETPVKKFVLDSQTALDDLATWHELIHGPSPTEEASERKD